MKELLITYLSSDTVILVVAGVAILVSLTLAKEFLKRFLVPMVIAMMVYFISKYTTLFEFLDATIKSVINMF